MYHYFNKCKLLTFYESIKVDFNFYDLDDILFYYYFIKICQNTLQLCWGGGMAYPLPWGLPARSRFGEGRGEG